MIEKLENQFTKYELARILGARALQVAMDAPLLLKIDEKKLEEINYNPIEIAKMELETGVLPITVNKPLPKRKESKIKKLSREELEEIKRKEETRKLEEESKKETKKGKKKEVKVEDKVTEPVKEDSVAEATVEEKATEDAEIMELASPEDEIEEESSSGEEEGV